MVDWNLLAGRGDAGSVGPTGATGATGDTGATGAGGYKNAIINGAFNIWQRGTSFAALAANSYTADRWKIGHSTSGVITVTQDSSAPPALATSTRYFNYAMKIACTTADSSIAATDQMALFQCIEGFNWQAFAQQNLVVTFYVKSSKTGTYSVGLTNNVDRTIVAEWLCPKRPHNPNPGLSIWANCDSAQEASRNCELVQANKADTIHAQSCQSTVTTSPCSESYTRSVLLSLTREIPAKQSALFA